MKALSQENVLNDIIDLLTKLSDDWDYSDEITPEIRLVRDLALESIDIVVLCTSIEKHYGRSLPFAQFLASVGERAEKDIQVRELVEFIYQSLADPSDAPVYELCNNCSAQLATHGNR